MLTSAAGVSAAERGEGRVARQGSKNGSGEQSGPVACCTSG
jgi:hypothetical protein